MYAQLLLVLSILTASCVGDSSSLRGATLHEDQNTTSLVNETLAIDATATSNETSPFRVSNLDVRGVHIPVLAVALPTVVMLMGGLAAGCLRVSQWGLCASQYFSAGLILAVCFSLASEIPGRGLNAVSAMCGGFALGLCTMVAVKKIAESLDNSEEVEQPEQSKAFPWPLVFGVAIDSLVDGLLVGMVGIQAPKSALMLSAATSLEMGALGLSFAAALTEHCCGYRIACIVAMPAFLAFGGLLGCVQATALENSHLAMTGMLSFGISALVYLVTQELLVEANASRQEVDKRGRTTWFLFAGVLIVMVLKILEEVPIAV